MYAESFLQTAFSAEDENNDHDLVDDQATFQACDQRDNTIDCYALHEQLSQAHLDNYCEKRTYSVEARLAMLIDTLPRCDTSKNIIDISMNSRTKDASGGAYLNAMNKILEKDEPVSFQRSVLNLTLLHYVAYHGHTQLAEHLIKEGCDVNPREYQFGWTPLHLAALGGHEALAKLLLEKSAHANVQDTMIGWTPIHCAAVEGHRNIIKLLSEHGCDASRKDKFNWTALQVAHLTDEKKRVGLLREESDPPLQVLPPMKPLHAVAAYGSQAVAHLLFTFQGIELLSIPWISTTDSTNRFPPVDVEGRTLLHVAVRCNRKIIVEQLLHMFDLEEQDKAGNNALHHAVQAGCMDLARVLVDRGAKCGATNNHLQTILHLAAKSGREDVFALLSKDDDIDIPDKDGRTPLMLAAMSGRLAMFKRLASKGANPRHLDKVPQTPLAYACKAGHLQIVQQLVATGVLPYDDESKYSPMDYAVQARHVGIVSHLLNHGASATKTTMNCGLLYSAVIHKDIEIVRLLIASGADIDELEERGRTPLFYACGQGSSDMVNALLSMNANINHLDWSGQSPLSVAAEYEYEALILQLLEAGANAEVTIKGEPLVVWGAKSWCSGLVEWLINKGANLNTVDDNHRSLLSLAAENGDASIVELLMEQGADVSLKDRFGATALSLAIQNGHDEIVDLLTSDDNREEY